MFVSIMIAKQHYSPIIFMNILHCSYIINFSFYDDIICKAKVHAVKVLWWGSRAGTAPTLS